MPERLHDTSGKPWIENSTRLGDAPYGMRHSPAGLDHELGRRPAPTNQMEQVSGRRVIGYRTIGPFLLKVRREMPLPLHPPMLHTLGMKPKISLGPSR
jgi:hypothetical protein